MVDEFVIDVLENLFNDEISNNISCTDNCIVVILKNDEKAIIKAKNVV
ncbi:MAG: hypothetical protein IJA61_02135 [Clostridia bacterium]|nr:hypothetical protein [Clostridia bacterium]